MPLINPAAHMSREKFRELNQLNHLNEIREDIKDCYTPDMVEHIQNKFKQLYTLISKNESRQMPKGSMLDMIEQVTRMSHYQDKFNKQRFFKNAKYVK